MRFQKIIQPILCIGDKLVAGAVCNLCSGYLKKGDRVLDLGCGSGLVGKALIKLFNIDLIGIDIEDTREEKIPFKKSDGKKLPFSDKHFDAVLISYVFHHTKNSDKILREAIRVSKRYIFILEDTPDTIIDRFICRLHGFGFKMLFGLKDSYQFHSKKEWIDYFRVNKLKLKKIINIRYNNPIYNPPRTGFILYVPGKDDKIPL